MVTAHPRGATDGPADEPDGSLRRRRLLRTAVGAGAWTLGGVATTTTDAASAQEDAVTTDAALPADAPTLGNPDYTGLFVHVAGENRDAETPDVGGCAFVGTDDEVVVSSVTLVDRESEDTPQGASLLFSLASDEVVSAGKLFIVADQRSCEGDHVQISLEEVGAADIATPRVGADDGTPTGGTATDGAGFGAGGALAGLVGAVELLRRRG